MMEGVLATEGSVRESYFLHALMEFGTCIAWGPHLATLQIAIDHRLRR